jgi:hypothetical protein
MMVEDALELLISPAWRELSVGRQTLGQWVAERRVKSDRCPFSQAVELRVGRGLKSLLPELQVRADVMSFELWKTRGLPLNSRASVCVCEELQTFGHSTLWRGELLNTGEVAEGCSELIQAVAQSVVANGARLLGPKQLDEWLRLLARRHPKLVSLARRAIERDELIWVLQSLLDERAPIRRLDLILSALLECPVSPLEATRLAVAGDIVSAYAPEFLNVITIIPRLEQRMVAGDFRTSLKLLKCEMDRFPGRQDLVLLCRVHQLRFRLRQLVKQSYPHLAVMSWREVALGGVNVNTVAILETSADRLRTEQWALRCDRRRQRQKESREVFFDRLFAKRDARIKEPYL